MKWHVEPWVLTFPDAVRNSGMTFKERRGFRLRCEDEKGVFGWGESCPLESFGTESLKQCEEVLSRSLPETVFEIENSLLPFNQFPAARHGIETALLDCLARSRQVPLHAVLTSRLAKTTIDVSGLLLGSTHEQILASAEKAIADGFWVAKLKVGVRSLDEETKTLVHLKENFGDRLTVRVDANGSWTSNEAQEALGAWKDLSLELCEQPVAAGSLSELNDFAKLVAVPIAADESVGMTWNAPLLNNLKALVLKPMVLGGILNALKIAVRASELNIATYVTTSLDGPIARAHAAHLAAALPGTTLAHGLGTVELFSGISPDLYSPVGGQIKIPEGYGIGVGR